MMECNILSALITAGTVIFTHGPKFVYIKSQDNGLRNGVIALLLPCFFLISPFLNPPRVLSCAGKGSPFLNLAHQPSLTYVGGEFMTL